MHTSNWGLCSNSSYCMLAWDFVDYTIRWFILTYSITFGIEQNLKTNAAIYNSIRDKFVPKYLEFFSASVLENWSCWFDGEQKLRIPQGISSTSSTLILPQSMPAHVDLKQLCPASNSVNAEDCALSDLPDNIQFVTFSNSNGRYGEFSRTDIMVPLTLAEIEFQNAKACILLNFACIYKFGLN